MKTFKPYKSFQLSLNAVFWGVISDTLQSRHMNVVSSHQQFECLFNNLFMLTINKTSKLCLTYHLWGIRWLLDNSHKGSIMRTASPYLPIFAPMTLKSIQNSPINYKSALVKVFTWQHICGRPLTKPTMTRFYDQAVWCQWCRSELNHIAEGLLSVVQ